MYMARFDFNLQVEKLWWEWLLPESIKFTYDICLSKWWWMVQITDFNLHNNGCSEERKATEKWVLSSQKQLTQGVRFCLTVW